MYFITIAHRDDYEMTLRCIENLYKHCNDFKIILIDNSKNKYKYPDNIIVLRQKDSLSVTKSWNLGLLYSIASKKCDKICIMSNDVIIENDIFHYCDKFIEMNAVFSPCFDENIYSDELNMLFCLGAPCFMARKVLFMNLGFFDERFFLYYQDSDYFERIRLLGYISLQLNNAKAKHIQCSNSKKIYSPSELHTISKSDVIEFRRKNYWVNTAIDVLPSIFFREFLEKNKLNI